MQYHFKKNLIKSNLTKLQLSIIIIIYLSFLNGLTHQSFTETLSTSWLVVLFGAIVLLFSITHQWLFKLFLTSQIFITSIAIFAKSQYQITITEDILLSALISENDLTAEMISLPLLGWLLLTAVVPTVWLWSVKVRSVKYYKQLLYYLLLAITFIASAFVIVNLKGYQFKQAGNIRDERFIEDLIKFSPLDALYNFNRALRAKKRMAKTYANVEILSNKFHYQSQVDDLLVVFVLGESSRGDRFAINGYSKNTTPKLAKIPNLISFRHATSCDTLTINAIHCLASPMLKSQPNREISQSSFGEVLDFLGYQTDIYSLQTLTGFYQYLHYDNVVTKYTVLNEQNFGAKDQALFPYVQQAITNYQQGKKLIIAHTLGSHQTYVDRFTKNHAIFQPYCTNPDVSNCSLVELNNAYDNSIVAVDNFLADIVQQLQDKKALFIYVSDHGESLGENGNYFHGKPVAIAPKEQFDIPFIIWFSDKYRATPEGQQLLKNLQKNFDKQLPVSHDNVFHTLLGCAGIVSNNGGIEKQLNLCEINQ